MSARRDGGLRDVVSPDRDPQYVSFQRALIEHFRYRWSLPKGDPNAIVWPRRNGDLDDEVADCANHK
jgi:hypothetical protein